MPMLNIIGILPLVFGWVACYCLARELAARNRIDADWRVSWALASVTWGGLLTFTIELGSLGRLLTAPVLWTVWAALDLALFAVIVSLARRRGIRIADALRAWIRNLLVILRDWPLDARCYLVVTAAFALLLFGLAMIFATTNWDSLNYHLSRIMHWMQAGSIEHFPTHNTRQIEFAPWQSFLSLTLYLLWGGDRLLNLVQWCAMAGSLVIVSYMVKALARPQDEKSAAQCKRMTGFALIVAVTIPIGLVECMNPQNDYTAAFWLCCLAAFALALVRQPENPWYMLGAGLACGLGTLTKATTYVYAAPLIVGLGVWWLSHRFSLRIKLRHAAVFCLAFVALNAGHCIRNYAIFDSPLGSKHIFALEKNKPVSVSGTAANVIRNVSLHSSGAIPPLTTALQSALSQAHQWTGREFADAETTYRGHFSMYPEFHIFDSFAACTYHVLLVFLALMIAAWKFKEYRTVLWQAGWIITSFILFCAYLKWQYNHSRLHLAYLLVFAPIIARVIADRLPLWAVAVVSAGLVVFGGYSLSKNASRPFLHSQFTTLPREQQHLAIHARKLTAPIQQLADVLVAARCENVGMKLAFDDPEYVIWAMLRNRGFTGVLHHVYVENESARLAPRYPHPPVIITTAPAIPDPVTKLYPFSLRCGPFTILSQTSLPARDPGMQEFSQKN